MHRLLLPALLLSLTAAAAPEMQRLPQSRAEKQRLVDAQFGQIPTVNTTADLDWHLNAAVKTMNPMLAFRLGKELRAKDFSSLIGNSAVQHDIISFSSVIEKNSGEVHLELVYHDGARMSAALHYPHLRKQLTKDEESALAEIERRFAALHEAHPEPYDFLLAAHDDLIRRSTYKICKETDDGSVAVLINKGIGVCAAYTDVLRLMLDMAQIPNQRIVGKVNGTNHIWNLVYIDGAWRHVDATWDDPVVPKGQQQRVEHTYFCCSDADMARDHTWSKAGLPPVSTEPPLYLTRNGLYHRSFAELWQAAEQAAAKGAASYTAHMTDYGSPAKLKEEAERYMNNGGRLHIGTVSAPKNKSYGTVTLEFGKK